MWVIKKICHRSSKIYLIFAIIGVLFFRSILHRERLSGHFLNQFVDLD